MSISKEKTCRTCLVNTQTLTSLDKQIVIDDEVIDLKRILETCSDLKVRFFNNFRINKNIIP